MSPRRAISLVAWREIRERLRSAAFLWSTVIMLVIVGASSALPMMLRGDDVASRWLRHAAAARRRVARAAEPLDAKRALRSCDWRRPAPRAGRGESRCTAPPRR